MLNLQQNDETGSVINVSPVIEDTQLHPIIDNSSENKNSGQSVVSSNANVTHSQTIINISDPINNISPTNNSQENISSLNEFDALCAEIAKYELSRDLRKKSHIYCHCTKCLLFVFPMHGFYNFYKRRNYLISYFSYSPAYWMFCFMLILLRVGDLLIKFITKIIIGTLNCIGGLWKKVIIFSDTTERTVYITTKNGENQEASQKKVDEQASLNRESDNDCLVCFRAIASIMVVVIYYMIAVQFQIMLSIMLLIFTTPVYGLCYLHVIIINCTKFRRGYLLAVLENLKKINDEE